MRKSPLTRKTRLSPGGRPKARKRINPVNRRRKAKAILAAYGPAERRAWMTALPCCFCGRVATVDHPSVQAHTGKKPGKGLKSGYETCVPMCDEHHRAYDEYRDPFDWPPIRRSIEMSAKHYAKLWQAHINERGVAA